jgi:hypothetical protein
MINTLKNIIGTKKQSSLKSDLIPKGVARVTYPFEGYEKLSLGERYKVIGETMIKNKVNLQK